MSSIPSKNVKWREFFTEKAKDLTMANSRSSLLLDLSIPEELSVKSISNFVSESISIIMCFSSASRRICFLHSQSDLGGNIMYPRSKVVALDGFNQQAYPVVIGNESIIKVIDKQVPTIDTLNQMENAEDIKGLSLSESEDIEVLSSHPFIILPPFLWNTASSLSDRSAENVFLEFSKHLKLFAEENKDKDALKEEKLLKDTRRIFQFLWLVSKNQCSSIEMYPPSDDEDVLKWSKSKHETSLGKYEREKSSSPSPQQVTAPPQVTVTNENSSNEAWRKSFEQVAQLATQSEKKKGFEKLHDSSKNLILNATSSNGQVRAGTPCTECEEFYKARTHGDAKLIFSKSMKYNWNCSVDVASGVIVNLYNGSFCRDFIESPSNFSLFSFPKKSFLGGNSEKESLLLQLKEMSGNGLSSDDIKQAMSQEITIPRQIDFMHYNIKNTKSAAGFFFSSHSLLARRGSRRPHRRKPFDLRSTTIS